MKFKVGDEVYIKGKIVYIGGDIGAPYRIQTELYIDDYKDLWGDDDDLLSHTGRYCADCNTLLNPDEWCCPKCGGCL